VTHSFPAVRLVLTEQDEMYSKFHCGENETEIKQVKKFYEFQPMPFFTWLITGFLKTKALFPG